MSESPPKQGTPPAQNAPPKQDTISQMKMRLDQLISKRPNAPKAHAIKRLFKKPEAEQPKGESRITKLIEKIKSKIPTAAFNRALDMIKANKPAKDDIDIAKIFRKQVQGAKDKPSASERKRRLVDHMEKAGLELEPSKVPHILMTLSAIITTIALSIWLYKSITANDSVTHLMFISLVICTLGLFVAWIVSWITFLIYLDVMMYQRKLSIEEVLPDFLQLTSANIRAGMPIDRALWFAVRPKFGVLAKEIEDVGKRTLSGEDLNKALMDFANKYDSPTLQRSVNLLIEGTEAGGDIGDLLNKIADNITELRAMKREMSASVMTYAIFITFASIIAAPVLFALSEQLLTIIQKIGANVGSTASMPKGMLSFNVGSDTIKQSDFRNFIYISMTVSSFFSALIITTIRKGDVKEGIHYIPIFIAVAFIVFLIASSIMSAVFSGIVIG